MKNTKFETSNGWVFNLRPNNIQQAYSFDVVLSDRDCKTLSGMMLRIAELEAENERMREALVTFADEDNWDSYIEEYSDDSYGTEWRWITYGVPSYIARCALESEG